MCVAGVGGIALADGRDALHAEIIYQSNNTFPYLFDSFSIL